MEITKGNHVHRLLLSLLHHLWLVALTLSISLEAYIFLQNCKPASHLLPLSLTLLFPLLRRFLCPHTGVYLVDFSCLKPAPRLRVPVACLLEHLSMINVFEKESIDFMAKVITSSGIGNETYFPPSLHYIPLKTHYIETIKEAEMLLFPVLDDLLLKTNLSPSDVDILIINCSGFCSSPSLSAMVVNHFGMREDVRTFNLSGMGCSAGAIAVDLARNLLKVQHDSYAVILSTEIISTGWYPGKDRRMLLLNCIFRMGSAAVLLTNRSEDKKISKYELRHLVRTHQGSDDKAYQAAMLEEDADGLTGFSIKRDLLLSVREALRANAMALGAIVLPPGEKLKYIISYLRKKVLKASGEVYVPDFGKVIRHYCIPPSGLTVMKEIGKGLRLSEKDLEAALMTFHRFGNQSSSSLWYQLAYMEAKESVRKDESVWMVAMGSGVKCNAMLWRCLRELKEEAEKGPWFKCIDRYPVDDETALQSGVEVQKTNDN